MSTQAPQAPTPARPAPELRRAPATAPGAHGRRRRGRLRERTLSSITNRLALVFAAITLSAIAVIYLTVAPSLGTSLRNEKLTALADTALRFSAPLARTIGSNENAAGVAGEARRAAAFSGARVTLMGVSTVAIDNTVSYDTYPISDSATATPGTSAGELSFPVASDAARTGRELTASENTVGGSMGEAAVPLRYQGRVARVVVFTESLGDIDRSVALIRRRILLAGALALALALIGGYVVARALSHRVKRLEQAAWRVAEGDFTARFEVDSQDELGQLAQALDAMQRQLAQLDSARERFIATASHELRTPIFSLGGFLELIQDEELDEETRQQFLGQLRTQVDRLGKLATGLLDLSRLEAGGLELHPEPSDLSAIARTVTSEFIPALAQHGSHLQLRLAQEPLPVTCDPERVAQIARILIDNALTHTPPGTNIVVTANVVSGGLDAPVPTPPVRLAVRDFGPGMPGAAMTRIFEPFYTSDGVQGSGLGLAIAYELAERMGGRLAAESQPGRTVFTLELPR